MHVRLGRRGDYAIRSSIDLARHCDGEARKAREIAVAMDIPPGFLKQVLADLVSAGILDSCAGPNGGYRLARPAHELDMLSIVDAAEGPFTVTRCVLRGGPCDWALCPVHDAVTDAHQAFADVLAGTSLADLAQIDAAIECGIDSRPARPHLEPTARRGIRTWRNRTVLEN